MSATSVFNYAVGDGLVTGFNECHVFLHDGIIGLLSKNVHGLGQGISLSIEHLEDPLPLLDVLIGHPATSHAYEID